MSYTKTEAERRHVEEGASYILNNWSAAKTRLAGRKYVVGCRAEGHVSHVLADRMTSRPMGWSRTGADKMAHLRAYYYNYGDMLELVRMQKEELPHHSIRARKRIEIKWEMNYSIYVQARNQAFINALTSL